MNSTQKRDFKMDPGLLWHVIHSQAGTQGKALLETVMNTIDAKATSMEINLSNEGFVISDDGKGFGSMGEIERFFETFGTPHKDGDATYGKYRMGRGQIFAFSKNKWHSGAFQMSVDIKNKGLEYDLKEDKNDY